MPALLVFSAARSVGASAGSQRLRPCPATDHCDGASVGDGFGTGVLVPIRKPVSLKRVGSAWPDAGQSTWRNGRLLKNWQVKEEGRPAILWRLLRRQRRSLQAQPGRTPSQMGANFAICSSTRTAFGAHGRGSRSGDEDMPGQGRQPNLLQWAMTSRLGGALHKTPPYSTGTTSSSVLQPWFTNSADRNPLRRRAGDRAGDASGGRRAQPSGETLLRPPVLHLDARLLNERELAAPCWSGPLT